MIYRLSLVALGVLACYSASAGVNAPSETRVETRDGVLIGMAGQVSVFKGIPFAAAPVGKLRWREPQPVRPWNEPRQAINFGPDPIQSGGLRPTSEDCLYLNVWTPNPSQTAQLPVMVWFYGGGFTAGSGADPLFDGTAFARKGVVLVTANYRVGLFGFMAHRLLTAESPHRSSGNYGLMDQVAALRWVRDNIGAFGGDPGRVTAFGESAGASSLSVLLTSPQMNGLVQRVILESPGSMRPLYTLEAAEKAG